MARLFATPREIALTNDWAQELIKDVVGQKIYYFSISELKTKLNVYQESPDKIFDNPIEIPALVDNVKNETVVGPFGPDEKYTVEAYIQYKDLINKEIDVSVGDFFSYGDAFFEIDSANIIRAMYGQTEHKDGIKINATKAREGQFKSRLFGPTDIKYADSDAVQTEFVQSRGLNNSELENSDKRELLENETLEKIDKPKEISGKNGGKLNTFYDE